MKYKAQRKGFRSDENEWIEGTIIQDGERLYMHSDGCLTKKITEHYIYALCVEIDKESLTPINENQNG